MANATAIIFVVFFVIMIMCMVGACCQGVAYIGPNNTSSGKEVPGEQIIIVVEVRETMV